MKFSFKPLIAAFIGAATINLFGVLYFFKPIADADSSATSLVPPFVGFMLYVAFTIALFDWAARQLQNAYKAAFLVGASQFLLVNVDYVLSGKRGIITGAASTVLMLVTWVVTAHLYSRFSKTDNK